MGKIEAAEEIQMLRGSEKEEEKLVEERPGRRWIGVAEGKFRVSDEFDT